MSILTDQGGGSTELVTGASTVHNVTVVFKTHLDLGFTDTAAHVEDRYLNDFFPRAMTLAREMRERESPIRFVWTTGSYMFDRLLEDGSPELRRQAEEAIAAGDLRWHALPFTFHSELLDPDLLRSGLAISKRMDARFGKTTITAKMTDVPGHTRGIVPILVEAGVRYLHIGVNPFSRPLDVPRLFRWEVSDGISIIVHYDPEDYGITTVPESADFAICFAHTGDNAGPATADDVEATFARLQANFPDAIIEAGGMEDFAARLVKIEDTLPIVTEEFGDTWIHGVGTAPRKMSAYRALLRERASWPAETQNNQAFDRHLLCVAEHTWGMSRARLDDYQHNTPKALAEFRKHERCQQVEASWREQEAYITKALNALPTDSPQRNGAETAVAATLPKPPDTSARTKASYDLTLNAAGLEVTVCHKTGAVISLQDQEADRQWADADHPLGLFQYQAFSQARCEAFIRHYGRWNKRAVGWGPISFARPDFDPQGKLPESKWLPTITDIHQTDSSVVLWAEMDPVAVKQFGCPGEVTLEWRITGDHTLELTLQTFDRQASRLPDAMWCSMQPIARNMAGWRFDKLGQWIDPFDIRAGGNAHLHAVGEEGVRYTEGDHSLQLQTLDAPLIAPGTPEICRANDHPPMMWRGIHVNLWNNWWNTNFPYWNEDDLRFRFRLSVS